MDDKLRNEIDSACQVAEEFVKLFYDSFDKKRSLVNKFFLDTGILCWDGNASVGNSKIQEFVDSLPQMDHFIVTLDAQPVLSDAVQNQKTVLIKANGHIRMTEKKEIRCFSETFLVTAQEDKWKIASDTFRSQQPIDKAAT